MRDGSSEIQFPFFAFHSFSVLLSNAMLLAHENLLLYLFLLQPFLSSPLNISHNFFSFYYFPILPSMSVLPCITPLHY